MATFTPVTISNISYSNTFGQWVTTTNSLVIDHNNFVSNGYIKSTGTLYLNDSSLGLQTSNATVQGYFQVAGVGSSAYVQNNLRVDSQVYFTNTILGLTNTGQANIGGLLLALGSNTGLAVSNNTTIGGYLNVSGNTNISNTLTVASTTTIGGATTVSNTVSISGTTTISNNAIVSQNTTVGHYLSVGNDISAVNEYLSGNETVLGLSTTNTLQANSGNIGTLTGQTIYTSGTHYTNTLQANTNVNTATISVTGTTYTNTLQANTNVNTSILSVTGTTYTNTLQANTNVNTSILSVTGTGYINTLQANSSVNTNTLSVTGTGYINTLQANTNVNTSTLSVTGTTYTNVLVANTSLTTPTATISTQLIANNATGFFNNLQTLGQLSVGGNFVINGATVYNSNVFTINANSNIGQISTFNVNRGSSGANASIRWNELSQYWDLNDVNNSTFYRIHTDEFLTNSLTSTSTSLIATANAANALYTYLTSNVTTLNSNISSNVATLNSNISSNVTALNSSITSNVATLNSSITSNVTTINSNVASLNTYSYSAYARANLGIISVTSNVNSPVIVTGNTLYPNLNLTSSGVTAGTYGSASAIPTVTVDTYGRVTSLSTSAVSSSLPISGNTGTGSVNLLNQTLQIISSNTQLVNVVASGNTITISHPNSGVTAGTYGSASAIPTVTVDAAGRVQAISTNAVSSTLNTSGSTGTGSVNLTNQTLQIISSNTSLVNITASGNTFTISHPNSGVTSGSYGSATAVPVFTVDAAGRVQSATTASIAIPLSQVTSGLGTSVAATLGNAAGAAGGFATYNQLGSAAFTATTAYQAAGTYLGGITYGSHTNANYQILWGSGNAVYGTDYLFVNPSSGALYSYNNITAYYSSDKKFKENIRPIPNALNMVTEIGGKLYDWKDEYLKEQNTPDEYFMRKSDFGVIAQDLIKAGFEVAVRERPDGSLAVDYEKLCALAFQAIAELKQEVDELKK